MTAELHQTPFRHYKIDGSWTSAGQRVASVTTVLSGSQENLQNWAVNQTAAAFTSAIERWYGLDDGSDGLTWTERAELTNLMPDQVRDAKAAIGTACHTYLADRLLGWSACDEAPYGYRAAIDAFLRDMRPTVVTDQHGPCVERAVGDAARVVAGTYDAVVQMYDGPTHRIDLKSSNSLQGKYWAQLAEYERLAVACGETRSDFLTIVHIDGLGNYALHSIPTGGPEEEDALAYFDAALALYRLGPQLGKLAKP